MENMAGKVVLITGASSAIGEHIAYEYAKRGAYLVLVATREDCLGKVAGRARQLGSPDVVLICADVSQIKECKRFVEEAVNHHFGRLDHLVCNTGTESFGLFEDAADVAKFAPVMDVNFWGSVAPACFAIPHLRKSRGRIVVNASVLGWTVSPWASVYGATKAALVNFYETFRIDLKQEVKITTVAPAFIEAEMLQEKHSSNTGDIVADEKMRKIMVSLFAVRSSEECAKAIVNGACRGDRYVIEPPWYKVFILFQFVCPGLVQWCAHWLFTTSDQVPPRGCCKKRMF
ncbi:PREDICTED: 11-beta-hydroxysteroid dehydrogenase 1B-like isoform X2 [Nelumbo nucifera]|nr:PREDICTED: 11-beta-hydroxysteroid dehydrogenase 1B-like isoform X2 [Nelumbo nucifera]